MVEFYANKNEIKISDRSVAILVVGGVVMSIIGRLNFDFSTINIYYCGRFFTRDCLAHISAIGSSEFERQNIVDNQR